MSDSEAKYMKKKVTTGEIEADLETFQILVHYELEVSVLSENNEPIRTDKKKDVRKLKISSLNENTNVPLLAQQIIDKCRLIHPSKLALIESLLYTLKERRIHEDKSNMYIKKETNSKKQPEPVADPTKASMDKLEEYIEQLYETAEVKLSATNKILALARNQDNLENLLNDETLFGALARLFRENGNKDIALATNISQIFFCFSTFSQFHPFLAQNRVGDSCMRVVESEVERSRMMDADYANLKRDLEMKGGQSATKKLEAETEKYKSFREKQTGLLRVCFYILLNLAEDVSVEKKMKKRNLVANLIEPLDWEDPELIIVILTFLKKLSIFKENKDDMAANGAVSKLIKFISSEHEAILLTTLKLMLNLSFDIELQQQMVKHGAIPKLVELIPNEDYRLTVLKILYHLSMTDKYRSLFNFTDAIPMIMKLILETPADQFVGKELLALAVNLAGNQRSAEMMAEGEYLKLLIQRVKRTWDPLIMKLLRNISSHEGKVKDIFMNAIADLVMLTKKCKTDDFLVEVLGTLANLAIPKYNWAQVMQDYDIIDFLAKHLVPGYSEDDIVLEVVILIGTMAQDKRASNLMANTSLIPALVELLLQKQEDDEIVLQTIFTFYRLLQHKESRLYLLQNTKVAKYLMDLLSDKNNEIRKMSSVALDIVMEYDKEWAKQIREKKFQAHNNQWVEIVSAEDKSQNYSAEENFEEDDMSDYYERDRSDSVLQSNVWSNVRVA